MKLVIIKVTSILIFSILLVSCNTQPAKEQEITIVDTIQKILGTGSCQYLTSDHTGAPVICWVNEDTANSDNNLLMVSTWNIDKNAFNDPISVPGTKGVQAHEEGMSKIAFRKNGDAVIMFSKATPTEKSKYAATVYYICSEQNLEKFSEPSRLVKDTSSYSQRFFDLSLNTEGEISAVWLDSRKEEGANGSSLYYAETLDGAGFTNERKIVGTTCECCRTKLYRDPDGNLNVAFRDIINDSIRDMSYTASVDGGDTFSEPVRISNDNWVLNGCPHTGPDMTWANARMNFTWYTQGGEEGVYYCSSSNRTSFSERLLVSNTGRHPQIESDGDDVHIIYEQIVRTPEGIDRPLKLWSLLGQDQRKTLRTVSSDKVKASYPVMYNYTKGYMLIAWGEKINNVPQIVYRMVKL